MPAWSRFILAVFAPHWLKELEDDGRRMSEAAAKQKGFHSTKAHGNGGGSDSRDGNAGSGSRECNGGSFTAGDDAVADNLAPVVPTVKRRRTSHDKQSSNISTVSNAGVGLVVAEADEGKKEEVGEGGGGGEGEEDEGKKEKEEEEEKEGVEVGEENEGKKEKEEEEEKEGVEVGEENEGKKGEEVEEEEEEDDGLYRARAVEGAMKKRKRAIADTSAAIADTSASVEAAKRVRMRHDILCDVCNKRVKIQSLPRHKRVHETQTTYVCTYANCQAVYSRKDSLASHVKQRHS